MIAFQMMKLQERELSQGNTSTDTLKHVYTLVYFVVLPLYSEDLHPLAYEKPPAKYAAESILKVLLDPKLGKRKVCSVWPVAVENSSTFIVDITKLKHPDDVRKDFFGKWVHSGSHPILFKARITEDEEVEVERCAPGATGQVFYLRRHHCYHPSNTDFRRLMAFVSGRVLLVSAYFVGVLHANSCSQNPLQRGKGVC